MNDEVTAKITGLSPDAVAKALEDTDVKKTDNKTATTVPVAINHTLYFPLPESAVLDSGVLAAFLVDSKGKPLVTPFRFTLELSKLKAAPDFVVRGPILFKGEGGASPVEVHANIFARGLQPFPPTAAAST